MSGILQAFAYGRAFTSAPVNTVAPVVSGTATFGQTLSCTTGTWTGIPTPTYTYQWQRVTTPISGATSSTYVLVQADVGSTIRCVVTATNSVAAVSANSNSTAAVAATVPGAPTIGTATSTGTTTATVSYTAPASNGGATITSYTATSSPGGITGSLSTSGSGTITVTGLTASTSYTFTVKATNSAGQSAASAASNSITTASPTFVSRWVNDVNSYGGYAISSGNAVTDSSGNMYQNCMSYAGQGMLLAKTNSAGTNQYRYDMQPNTPAMQSNGMMVLSGSNIYVMSGTLSSTNFGLISYSTSATTNYASTINLPTYSGSSPSNQRLLGFSVDASNTMIAVTNCDYYFGKNSDNAYYVHRLTSANSLATAWRVSGTILYGGWDIASAYQISNVMYIFASRATTKASGIYMVNVTTGSLVNPSGNNMVISNAGTQSYIKSGVYDTTNTVFYSALASGTNGVIVQHNSALAPQWARQVTLGVGALDAETNNIGVDSSGNVYANFRYYNNSLGRYQQYLVKYNSSGTLQWQRVIEVTSSGFTMTNPRLSVVGTKITVTLGTYNVGGYYSIYSFNYPTDGSLTGTVTVGTTYSPFTLSISASSLTESAFSYTATTENGPGNPSNVSLGQTTLTSGSPIQTDTVLYNQITTF